MLYALELNVSQHCYMQIIIGNVNMRVLFFSQNPVNVSEEEAKRLPKLEPTYAAVQDISKVTDLDKYLICGAVLTKGGRMKMSFGSLRTYTQLSRDYSSVLHSASTNLDELVPDSFISGDFGYSITCINAIEYINSFGSNFGKGFDKLNVQKVESASTNLYTESEEAFRSQHLKTIKDIKHGLFGAEYIFNPDGTSKKNYGCASSDEAFEALMFTLEKLKSGTLMSVYFAVTGRYFVAKISDDYKSKLIGVGLSWTANSGMFVPLNTKYLKNRDMTVDFPRLCKELERFSTVSYDSTLSDRVLLDCGIKQHITHNVISAVFNLDSRLSKSYKNLHDVVYNLLGEDILQLGDFTGGKDGSGDLQLLEVFDKDSLINFACSEAEYAGRLYSYCTNELFPRQRKSLRLDEALVEITALADYFGVKIDMQLLTKLNAINDKDLKTLERVMSAYLHTYGLKAQAIAYLYAKYQGMSTTHEKSIDDSNIQAFEEEHKAQIEILQNDPEFKENFEQLFYKKLKSKKYPVPISFSADAPKMFFEILMYPVTRITKSGMPSAGKDARLDLLTYRVSKPNKFLKKNIMSAATSLDILDAGDQDSILLDADELASYKFPFALIYNKWSRLEKLKTSFFSVLSDSNFGGMYYTENALNAAETARIINPIQTLIGRLKCLIIPHEGTYGLDYDYNQIELRLLLGLACNYWDKLVENVGTKYPSLIKKFKGMGLDSIRDNMCDPLRDLHREFGSPILHVDPEDITDSQRKKVKADNFGIPFGESSYRLASGQLRFCRTTSEYNKCLETAEEDMANWKKTLYPIYSMMEKVRDDAVVPRPDSELPKHLKGTNTGFVENAYGRRRYLDLDPAPQTVEALLAEGVSLSAIKFKHIARLRRQIGNFPIQSFAREKYVEGLIKIQNLLKNSNLEATDKDNWKVLLLIFIHDENFSNISKTIHPYFMLTIILLCAEFKLPGHPTYFCGPAIINNWHDAKDDSCTVPQGMLEEIKAKYMANPAKYNKATSWRKDPKVYMQNRILEYMDNVYCKIMEQYTKHDIIDMDSLISNWRNYTLRPQMKMFLKVNGAVTDADLKKLLNSDLSDAAFSSALEDSTGEFSELQKQAKQAKIDLEEVRRFEFALLRGNPEKAMGLKIKYKGELYIPTRKLNPEDYELIPEFSEEDMRIINGESAEPETTSEDVTALFGTANVDSDTSEETGSETDDTQLGTEELSDEDLADFFSDEDYAESDEVPVTEEDMQSEESESISDMQDDAHDAELEAEKEAYLLSAEESTIQVFNSTLAKLEEDETEAPDIPSNPYVIEDMYGRISINITKCSTATFKKLFAYLQSICAPVGKEFIFQQFSRIITTNLYSGPNFDMEKVKEIIEAGVQTV